jgi:formylglycine-generating enzyme required for sulfatase activity
MKREKNGYRLPTEAEWEYAARGANTSAPAFKYYYAGFTATEEQIMHSMDVETDTNTKAAVVALGKPYSWAFGDTLTTQPVGSLLPNTIGLYDMSGNIQTWCWDKSDSLEPIGLETVTDPETPRTLTPSTAYRHVYRGGTFGPVSSATVSNGFLTTRGVSQVTSSDVASSPVSLTGLRVVTKAD